METFEASNGVPVRRTTTGTLSFTRNGSLDLGALTGISASQEEALREFFQHERDKELGRWRSKVNPEWVGYENGPDEAVLIHELSGVVHDIKRGNVFPNSTLLASVSTEYFAAHREPKPWMEVPEGVYAMRPDVHLYERLIMLRGGKWHHLYKHPSDGSGDPHSDKPEKIAEAAFREGRLTRLVAEVSDA